jgi:phosphoglycerate dehydrogenase-like enzyme
MRIAVLDDYQQVARSFADWSVLPADSEVVTFADHVVGAALARRLAGFDVVVAMRERTPLPAEVLRQLPDLQLIITTGMRNAVLDVEAARAAGITVCGTSGRINATTELTWGLIFAVLRHIPEEDAAVRAGRWQHTMGVGLAGKTLGLVGLGNIGTAVAAAGRAFQMDVVAWSQNLKPDRAAEAGVRAVSKAQLLQESDVVSVHYVLSERSQGIIGRDDLRQMKASAILINTSRGPLVEEEALIAALEEGWIAGAGLDVFDQEPLPDNHPLRRLRNTVVTPHIGYVTDDTYEIFFPHIVEDIAAWAAGQPIRVIS